MPRMKRRQHVLPAEQLSVGFEGIEEVPIPAPEPGPDTMRQIVSLRMPDALLERVEAAAQARGVSPSSLMRALIAAGLDRSYAVVAAPTEQDVAAELVDLRRAIDDLARRLPERPVAERRPERRP
jgi:predicted transcriptional regulator